ncbi:universal stress protein [Aurantiacibacter atlanticus]|nr:universal stress protein [Aurantiacibacter atlanticus]
MMTHSNAMALKPPVGPLLGPRVPSQGEASTSLRQEAQVLACLGEDENRRQVALHARAIAQVFGLELAFAQILEIAPHGAFPADPLEWNLRLAECRGGLEELPGYDGEQGSAAKAVVLPGIAHERLNDWAKDHHGSVLVLSKHSGVGSRVDLGRTAQAVLERGAASVLLLPPRNGRECLPEYGKILVPLDGSPNSESVLPIVARLAKARNSQVTLAHIAQHPDALSSGGSSTAQAVAEHWDRNSASRTGAVDRGYLETWKSRLVRQGIDARLCLESDPGPQERLSVIAARLGADLIVVSSHGRTNLRSVPYGSVTAFLAKNSACPVFIVRPDLRIASPDDEQTVPMFRDRAPGAESAG